MGVIKTIVGGFIALLNREREPRTIALSNFERLRHELRPCDVLLVEGRSRVSDVIRWVTLSPWTHAALYVGRLHEIEDAELREIVAHLSGADPQEQLVIESLLGYGTVVRSVECYANDHLRISRPKNLAGRDAQRVVRYAVSRLGYQYDLRQILDLGRFLFPWLILPRRWRSSLFRRSPGQTTRTVCSTMIAEAFTYVDFPILPLVRHEKDAAVSLYQRNPALYTPSDFDYSPYFEVIKYPFFDLNYSSNYRLLPWSGKMEMGDGHTEVRMDVAERTVERQVRADLARVLAEVRASAAEVNEKATADSPG